MYHTKKLVEKYFNKIIQNKILKLKSKYCTSHVMPLLKVRLLG